MSLRPLVSSSEPKVHRDEESALMRASSQRNLAPGQLDGSITSLDSRQTTPAPTPSSTASRRRVIIPDPVALRYLEEDPCVTVVERRQVVKGYELYLVEQWACSRQSPTHVIVTYTGDEKHSVVVGILGLPSDEKAWSTRLRVYFRAIQKYHARPKETNLGELMVTNLSSFPSALTVISVPDGDIRTHRKEFLVNEDLKRLGCSGRSGMTLSEPTGAAKAKFTQLYKTADKVLFSDAVIELVKMCQVALSLFGKLDQVYIDGLLCDITETAIGNWWTEFGAEYYNIEPADGILGPTTVAALLGLLMGARNRLSYFGAPVPKDVFDIDAIEKGISHFQKYQKLDRTRRLDRQTMHKLHSATAKAAAGEGWGVQKAVKSTMTEIGGKRGEIVLGMVGGRDKGGIGDIEGLDLDRFISLASGERAKWLWHGKPKRSNPDNHERPMSDMNNILFGKDDLSSQAKRVHSAPLEEEETRRREEIPGVYSATPASGSAVSIVDSPGERDALRRGFKSVARDARSGLGRIKDAVYSGGGLRGHNSRPSRDESSETTISGPRSSVLSESSAGILASPSPGPGQVGRAFTWKNKPEEYLSVIKKEREVESAPASVALLGTEDTHLREPRSSLHINGEAQKPINGDIKRILHATEIRNEVAAAVESSVAGSVVAEGDLQGPFIEAEQKFSNVLSRLYRRHSIGGSRPPDRRGPNEARWARRLSFGDAEEAVLRWDEVADLDQDEEVDNMAALEKHAYLTELARSLYVNILEVKQSIEPWVDAKIKEVEDIDDHYAQQQDDLQEVYEQHADAFRRAKENSREAVAEQRARITEAIGEVGVQAAKLEYEINALVSRVQDVEDGVAQFEIQVNDVERRADELKSQLETESWLHWAVRTLTGIGTGPNITRSRPEPKPESRSQPKSQLQQIR
ncbi:uncharacterized protein GGS22DRAFT_172641 [Annulohypoxylon maeteangense]|uniref:uncharacterized protein n=1 Tax=Annulohypoxylon maeteangense TaxID=1927788 RepID=UPI00200889F6|nr:uncharacterized protein GGS22DRAFT_172641 [Annulohypoxylon maeteangense]KAI0881198.1 hypothetical protein GGS22DRAFT_172641 [Annulohypoxylon maeteangense]